MLKIYSKRTFLKLIFLAEETMIVAAPQILEGFSSHQRAAQVSGDQGARAERLVCIPQRPGGMFLFLDSSLAIKTLMSARDSVGVGILPPSGSTSKGKGRPTSGTSQHSETPRATLGLAS